MSSLSRFSILGRVGAKPELRYTTSGYEMSNLSVAENKKYKKKDGSTVEKTEWYRVKLFGNQAVNCNSYLDKGSQVYIEGKLGTSSYEKNGQTIYSLDLLADKVTFISHANNDNNNRQQQPQTYQKPPVNNEPFDTNAYGTDQFNSDDIPF